MISDWMRDKFQKKIAIIMIRHWVIMNYHYVVVLVCLQTETIQRIERDGNKHFINHIQECCFLFLLLMLFLWSGVRQKTILLSNLPIQNGLLEFLYGRGGGGKRIIIGTVAVSFGFDFEPNWDGQFWIFFYTAKIVDWWFCSWCRYCIYASWL